MTRTVLLDLGKVEGDGAKADLVAEVGSFLRRESSSCDKGDLPTAGDGGGNGFTSVAVAVAATRCGDNNKAWCDVAAAVAERGGNAAATVAVGRMGMAGE